MSRCTSCISFLKKNVSLYTFIVATECPGSPRNLHVLEVTSHSVVLTCDVPRESKLPLLTWRLEVFPDGEPDNVSVLEFHGSGELTTVTHVRHRYLCTIISIDIRVVLCEKLSKL